MTAVIVIVVVLIVLVLLLILAFNGLVRKRNRTQEAWAQIDVELKRRHDLIPNLVETVKGYASHERETFEEVTRARAAAVTAVQTGSPAQIAPAENALTASLGRLMAVAENYPQLQAIQSFTQLQETLTATEDKISFARRYYNGSVRDYNTAIQTFPRSLIASSFGFQPAEYFEADEADRAVPQVSFADNAPGVSFESPSPTTPPAAPPAPTPPAAPPTPPSS
jgi:LemA protein